MDLCKLGDVTSVDLWLDLESSFDGDLEGRWGDFAPKS